MKQSTDEVVNKYMSDCCGNCKFFKPVNEKFFDGLCMIFRHKTLKVDKTWGIECDLFEPCTPVCLDEDSSQNSKEGEVDKKQSDDCRNGGGGE